MDLEELSEGLGEGATRRNWIRRKARREDGRDAGAGSIGFEGVSTACYSLANIDDEGFSSNPRCGASDITQFGASDFAAGVA